MPLDRIATEADLDERLSRPDELTVRAVTALVGRRGGDLAVIGAGGKMGTSLVGLARRSADAAGRRLRIVAVSRFSTPGVREALARDRIETIAADLLDPAARAALPEADNVLLLLGHKFAAAGRADLPGTYWAANAWLPAVVAERYRGARIVALSSGNVYPFVRPDEPAPTEDTPPAPVGEYAMTVWGREQLLAHLSARHGTPLCLLRLNYAVDLRYGVPVDLAQIVLAGQPVDLAVPEVNFVWQRYACAVSLAAFDLAASPATVLNVTGALRHRVRDVATRLGELLGVAPRLAGPEGGSSLVADAARCHRLFGPPDVSDEALVELVAAWMAAGGRTLGRPTMFHVRDGRYSR